MVNNSDSKIVNFPRTEAGYGVESCQQFNGAIRTSLTTPRDVTLKSITQGQTVTDMYKMD